MDSCQRASREVSVTEVTGKVCQVETAGEPGAQVAVYQTCLHAEISARVFS